MEPPRSARGGGVTGLLNRPPGSRLPPMPPSLQAKLTNMARRNNTNDEANDTAALLQQASIGSPNQLVPPHLRPAASYPPPHKASPNPLASGIAGRRRPKPNFSLKDINSGGASAAGLGQGRPSLALDDSRRGPLAHAPPGSLFSSFANVMYVIYIFFPFSSS